MSTPDEALRVPRGCCGVHDDLPRWQRRTGHTLQRVHVLHRRHQDEGAGVDQRKASGVLNLLTDRQEVLVGCGLSDFGVASVTDISLDTDGWVLRVQRAKVGLHDGVCLGHLGTEDAIHQGHLTTAPEICHVEPTHLSESVAPMVPVEVVLFENVTDVRRFKHMHLLEGKAGGSYAPCP